MKNPHSWLFYSFIYMRVCVCIYNFLSPLLFVSGFSPEVVFYTTGSLPHLPHAPRLVRAGITWIMLEWSRPDGCTAEELVTYKLEIQEENSVRHLDGMTTTHSSPYLNPMAFGCVGNFQKLFGPNSFYNV